MPFIQVIEYTTSRWDEMQAVIADYRKNSEGKRTTDRSRVCIDRGRPNHYVMVVEFSSYEEAMENSNLPETEALAEALAALCDAPPVFHDLEVVLVSAY